MKELKSLTKSLIVFMFLVGIILAILPLFNWDIFLVGEWAVEKIWAGIQRIADYFSGLEAFRKIFA